MMNCDINTNIKKISGEKSAVYRLFVVVVVCFVFLKNCGNCMQV